MYAATVSSRYQVVIPQAVREQFGVKPGWKLVFIPDQSTLRVIFVPPIEMAQGFLKGIDTEVEREAEDRI